MNTNIEPFELVPCEINAIVLENDDTYVVSIIIDEEEYGVPLIGYDGSILTFVDKGCHENAHINTIHQSYLRFKNDCGFVLNRVILEAKHGDIIYCRLHWAHKIKEKNIYNVVGIGDAIILSQLSQSPLFITKYVIGQLEFFDSEGYTQTFED
jgi:bifunctional DNase/RNase